MKNSTCLSTLLFALSSVFLFSCNDQDTKKGYNASIAGSNKIAPLSDEDLQFLFSAYNLNLFNCQLAKEAQIRSTSLEAAVLADSIIIGSYYVNDQINRISANYAIDLPSDITQEQKTQWKELVKQKGWEFDKLYLGLMESNLKNIHALFTEATITAKDETVNNLAMEGLQKLQSQGTLAIALQEKITERTSNDFIEENKEVAAHFTAKNQKPTKYE